MKGRSPNHPAARLLAEEKAYVKLVHTIIAPEDSVEIGGHWMLTYTGTRKLWEAILDGRLPGNAAEARRCLDLAAAHDAAPVLVSPTAQDVSLLHCAAVLAGLISGDSEKCRHVVEAIFLKLYKNA